MLRHCDPRVQYSLTITDKRTKALWKALRLFGLEAHTSFSSLLAASRQETTPSATPPQTQSQAHIREQINRFFRLATSVSRHLVACLSIRTANTWSSMDGMATDERSMMRLSISKEIRCLSNLIFSTCNFCVNVGCSEHSTRFIASL